MNILITGGAGFIGSNLALKLIERGHHIVVLDNLSAQIHGAYPDETSPLYNAVKGKVSFIYGNVTSREDWMLAIKGVDIIVHLAAETGTGQSMYEIEKYAEVNIKGTAIMLDALVNAKHTVKKIVVASSRAIYGEGKYRSKELGLVYPGQRSAADMNNGDFEVKYAGSSELEVMATDEESKIHPSSVYGITKQNQEQMVMTVCPTIGIAPVALRYQNVYGAGQSLSNPYTGILSIFSTRIKNGNSINIFEDGKESRDFVYIDDVVWGTVLCIENEVANGQVFNIGTGEPIDVVTVAKTLSELYETEIDLAITGNFRLGDIRHNFADITRIKTMLHFEPQHSFYNGVKKFVEWVNKQAVENDQFEFAINEMKKKGLYK